MPVRAVQLQVGLADAGSALAAQTAETRCHRHRRQRHPPSSAPDRWRPALCQDSLRARAQAVPTFWHAALRSHCSSWSQWPYRRKMEELRAPCTCLLLWLSLVARGCRGTPLLIARRVCGESFGGTHPSKLGCGCVAGFVNQLAALPQRCNRPSASRPLGIEREGRYCKLCGAVSSLLLSGP